MIKYVVTFVSLVVSAGLITGAVYFFSSDEEQNISVSEYQPTFEEFQPQISEASPASSYDPALKLPVNLDSQHLLLDEPIDDKRSGNEMAPLVAIAEQPLGMPGNSSFDFVLADEDFLHFDYQQGGFDSIDQVYSHPISNSSGARPYVRSARFVGSTELSSYRGRSGGAAGGGGSPAPRSAADLLSTDEENGLVEEDTLEDSEEVNEEEPGEEIAKEEKMEVPVTALEPLSTEPVLAVPLSVSEDGGLVEEDTTGDSEERNEAVPGEEVAKKEKVEAPAPALEPLSTEPLLADLPIVEIEAEKNYDKGFTSAPETEYLEGSGNGLVPNNKENLEAAVPVPEPATWILLGLGLVGLAKFRKHS